MQSIHPLRLKAKTTKYATTVPEERVPSRVLVFNVSALIFSSLSAQRLFNFLVCAQTCATLLWQFRKHDASCVCVCVCMRVCILRYRSHDTMLPHISAASASSSISSTLCAVQREGVGHAVFEEIDSSFP